MHPSLLMFDDIALEDSFNLSRDTEHQERQPLSEVLCLAEIL
jgi:hypothetical protein